mgnify:CR=1 FL=1
MAGRKTRRIRGETIEVPTDLEEATKFLAEIAAEQRAIDVVRGTMNATMEAIQRRAIDRTNRHQGRLRTLLLGLYAFACDERDTLTVGGQKSMLLPTGRFGWRLTPQSVVLAGQEKDVVARLEALGLGRFVKVEKSVSKTALLKEPETAQGVDGISIRRGEVFFVKPNEVETEIAESVAVLDAAS